MSVGERIIRPPFIGHQGQYKKHFVHNLWKMHSADLKVREPINGSMACMMGSEITVLSDRVLVRQAVEHSI